MATIALIALILSGTGGLVSLACWIVVLMEIHSDLMRGGTGKAVVGLFTCGVYAFVWAWQHGKVRKTEKVALVWTIALALQVVGRVLYALA